MPLGIISLCHFEHVVEKSQHTHRRYFTFVQCVTIVTKLPEYSSSKEKADRPAVEEFITLQHHFFTINYVNTTLGRLVYGAAVEVEYHTIAKALNVVG